VARDDRRALIERIEELRSSRVLAYVTSDRQPAPGQIGDDAVRPMYDHLRAMGHVDRLDLLIYSRGGAIDVPWRVVTALRQTSDEWNILVPFRANSAATLIALGADQIVLGRQGELGPIDPQLGVQRVVPQPGGGQAIVQEQVSLEDIMAYTKFVQERAGLSDQEALTASLGKLADRLDAVVLGNAYRTHLHIRDVASRMLRSRKDPANEQTMAAIIETLAERVYAHGHAIGLREADAIGLPVEAASDELDDLMWELMGDYEEHMKLLQPIDPIRAVEATDLYQESSSVALVESTWGAHEFTGDVEIRAKRQMPPNMNVNLTLNLQLPAGVNANELPAALQQALRELMAQGQQALGQHAVTAVQEAMKQQAPLAGVDAAFRAGKWEKTA
jgi:Serine dehydrogenase proteinase